MTERYFLGECRGLVIGIKLSDLPDDAAHPDSIPYPWGDGPCLICGTTTEPHILRAVDAQTYEYETTADEDEGGEL